MIQKMQSLIHGGQYTVILTEPPLAIIKQINLSIKILVVVERSCKKFHNTLIINVFAILINFYLTTTNFFE